MVLYNGNLMQRNEAMEIIHRLFFLSTLKSDSWIIFLALLIIIKVFLNVSVQVFLIIEIQFVSLLNGGDNS